MLSKRVKQARKALGLTQEKLGEKVGVSQESIRKIEAGETEMPHYIKELAVALDCSLSWLIEGTGTMKPSTNPMDAWLFESIGFLTTSQKKLVSEFISGIVSKNEEIISELSRSAIPKKISDYESHTHAHA